MTRPSHAARLSPGLHQEIAVWMWALEDHRRRTFELCEGLTEEELAWVPAGTDNSIGTLLYHCAATEMNWLFEDVIEAAEFPAHVARLICFPYVNKAGKLWPVVNESLAEHRARLDATRKILVEHFATLSVEDFRRERSLDKYTVTPEWVLYHLLEHEAQHAGQIGLLRKLYRAST